MGNVITSVSLSASVVKKLDEIVDQRLIPGVRDRSALVEYVLRKFLEELDKKET